MGMLQGLLVLVLLLLLVAVVPTGVVTAAATAAAAAAGRLPLLPASVLADAERLCLLRWELQRHKQAASRGWRQQHRSS